VTRIIDSYGKPFSDVELPESLEEGNFSFNIDRAGDVYWLQFGLQHSEVNDVMLLLAGLEYLLAVAIGVVGLDMVASLVEGVLSGGEHSEG
jgi:hypothetical protein